MRLLEKPLKNINFEDYILIDGQYGIDDIILSLEEIANALTGDFDASRGVDQLYGNPSVMVASNFNGKSLVSTREEFFKGVYATSEKECNYLWGENIELCEGMISLLKRARSIKIPKNQIWLADVLFFENDLRKEKLFGNDNFFTFETSGIKYLISEKDPIAKKVNSSKLGLAWRASYKGESLDSLKLFLDTSIEKIEFVPEVFQLDSSIQDITGYSTLSEDESKEIEKLIEKMKSREEFVYNRPEYKTMRLSSKFSKELISFKNFLLENNIWDKYNARGFKAYENNLYKKAKSLCKDSVKEKILEEKRLELVRIINGNRDLLDAIFFLLKNIIKIKEILIKKIIKMGDIEEIKDYISKGFLPASTGDAALIKRGPNMALIVSVIPIEACATTKILIKNWFNEDLSHFYEKIEPDNFDGGALEDFPEVKKYLQEKVFPDNDLLLKKNLRSKKNIDLNAMPTKKELYRYSIYENLKNYLKNFKDFNSYMWGTTPVVEFKIDPCPKTIRLFLKPRWDQGMSALKTKKEEELQVVYLKEMQLARKENRDFIIDLDKEDLLSLGINEKWLKSLENTSSAILNFLNEKFPGKEFIFSRKNYSSENIHPTMHELIDNLFFKIPFYKGNTKKDIWNPSDIYACDKNIYDFKFIQEWENEEDKNYNLEDVNEMLYQMYIKGEAIGFSLKKLNGLPSNNICTPMGAFISESSEKVSKFQIIENKITIPSFILGNITQNGIIFNTNSSFGLKDRWNYRLFGRNQLSLDINHGQAGKCPKYVLNRFFNAYGFAKFDTSKGFDVYINPSSSFTPSENNDYKYINKTQEINIRNLINEVKYIEELIHKKGLIINTVDGEEFNIQNWSIFINNSIMFLRNPKKYNDMVLTNNLAIEPDKEFLVRDQILTMLKLLNFLKVLLVIMQDDILWENSMTELYLECCHDTTKNAPYIKIS